MDDHCVRIQPAETGGSLLDRAPGAGWSTWRRVRPAAAWCTAVVVAVPLWAVATDMLRAVPYTHEYRHIEGVSNAGRVDARLYRGAQPTAEGFRTLRALGVDTVINLTLGVDEQTGEDRQVEALGMRYVHLPWSAVHDPPAGYVTALLDRLRSHSGEVVFIHCKAGVDRTGVMVAAYRVAVCRWPPARAIAEMNAFRYHSLFLPHLQRYVEGLPAALAGLEPLAATPAAP